jgi:hypothetical protein
MANNIIQIDISKIDPEVQEIEKKISELHVQIDELMDQIEFKKRLKKYALNLNGNSMPLTKEINSERAIKGISEFIINFLLNNGKSASKTINSAYADHLGKHAEEVRNNISNALSRLKDSGRIGSEGNGGKGGGHRWFAKKQG